MLSLVTVSRLVPQSEWREWSSVFKTKEEDYGDAAAS